MTLVKHVVVAATTCAGTVVGGVASVMLATVWAVPAPLFFGLPIVGAVLAAFLATPREEGALWLAPGVSAAVAVLVLYFILDWSSAEGAVLLPWVFVCFLAPLAATLLFEPGRPGRHSGV